MTLRHEEPAFLDDPKVISTCPSKRGMTDSRAVIGQPNHRHMFEMLPLVTSPHHDPDTLTPVAPPKCFPSLFAFRYNKSSGRTTQVGWSATVGSGGEGQAGQKGQ